MKTTIYWTLRHIRQTVREICFRAACWWLCQQLEFLAWRLRLESSMPSMASHSIASSVGRREQYTVHSL